MAKKCLKKLQLALEYLRKCQSTDLFEISSKMKDDKLSQQVKRLLREDGRNLTIRQKRMIEVLRMHKDLKVKFDSIDKQDLQQKRTAAEQVTDYPTMCETPEEKDANKTASDRMHINGGDHQVCSKYKKQLEEGQRIVCIPESPTVRVTVDQKLPDNCKNSLTNLTLEGKQSLSLVHNELSGSKRAKVLPKAPPAPSIASTWSPESIIGPSAEKVIVIESAKDRHPGRPLQSQVQA